MDNLRLATLFQLTPQLADMDVDHIGLRIVMVAPYFLDNMVRVTR